MKPRLLWVLLAGVVVYLNSLDNSFHYDDSHAIAENPHLRSLGNIPRFFTDPAAFSREPAMAMYRPVLLTSLALNYAVGEYRVLGYHLVNILVHSLAALLVGAVVREWFSSRWAGWWAGMLFALHPVHTQGVNYLSSRSELLCGLGVLAALYLAGRRRWQPLAWLAYALALLSKEAAVVLVPLLALQEARRPALQRDWKAHRPFWGITLAYLALITANGFLPRSLAQEVRPLGAQLCTQLKALVYYLQLMAMPVHLSVEHAFQVSPSPWSGAVLLSLLLVLSLLWCAWRSPRAQGSLGLGWFLAGLGLTFFTPLNALVNEHRLYLPFIGLLLVLPLQQRKLRWAGLGALVLLGLLSSERNRVWRDEYTLWGDAVARAPQMFRAQSNWGLALYGKGQVQEALGAFEKSLALNPRYGKTWSNLGSVYEDLGRSAEATRAYEQALALEPGLAGAHNNLGRLSLAQGDLDQAEAQLQQALALDPWYAQARVNLGLLRQQRGQLEAAAQEYETALRLDPTVAEALNNLGLLYLDQDRPDAARAILQRALQLKPEYQEARLNLELLELRAQGAPSARIYAQLVERYPQQASLWLALGRARAAEGDWQGAAAAGEEARRLSPGLRGVPVLLAGVYHQLGRLPEAVEACRQAIAQSPGEAALYNNLAAALAAAGRTDEALQATRQALELDPANARAAQNLRQLTQARGAP
ncbi:MAG: tetratricopeptide repeat protein [Candidatus Latescibacteria bacterium]|nr:tetratricopeptide repeat protein [Candidatus Latescibacterota bacterium]